jgi:light-regulated signal transduction histidine kinase (bacteriophytochrome)
VSHDLRAPLRSIDGFSQAVLDEYADAVDETGRDYLTRLRAASQRMGVLIDDILNLSRMSRGEMNRGRVDMSELAGSVSLELQERDPSRSVEVVIASGLNAVGDAGLLRVGLENLFANAFKFTATTTAARIEIGCERSAGEDVYFVRDNGVGFDMAYADQLFVPFNRLHAGNEYPGTGIGLATVRRIIRRHGGRIWAHGEVGCGATVYFTLREESHARD